MLKVLITDYRLSQVLISPAYHILRVVLYKVTIIINNILENIDFNINSQNVNTVARLPKFYFFFFVTHP